MTHKSAKHLANQHCR